MLTLSPCGNIQCMKATVCLKCQEIGDQVKHLNRHVPFLHCCPNVCEDNKNLVL